MGRNKRKKDGFAGIAGGIISIALFAVIGLFGNNNLEETKNAYSYENEQIQSAYSYDLSDIPEYNGEPYVTINNNVPEFDETDYTTESFETYSQLDNLGRCGVAYANICKDTMPPDGDERGDISSVKPTGWIQEKYDGEYLYNRCHLIGYQLSDEDDNELNLITGTRYFNVSGMLPFENQVADYIDEQGKNENRHVLYRVTPIFEDDDLLVSGVQIEAYSVEDHGQGICFNVFVYNVQPGVIIDYATGSSVEEN